MTGYISTIPEGTDNLSTSQGQMKTNFGVLQSLFAKDHGGWTSVAADGRHKQVTFYQVAAPGAQIAPSSIAYTKTVGTTPQEELFFKNSLFETQITSNGNAIWKGSPVGGENGEVTETLGFTGALNLPNGLQFRWGFVTNPSRDGELVKYADVGLSNFNTSTDLVFLTGAVSDLSSDTNADLLVLAGSESLSEFTLANTSSSAGTFSYVYWLAIGH